MRMGMRKAHENRDTIRAHLTAPQDGGARARLYAVFAAETVQSDRVYSSGAVGVVRGRTEPQSATRSEA